MPSSLLIQQLATYNKPCIWIADENTLPYIPQLGPYKKHLRLLTNRYDIYQHALQHGINSNFSDFDFSPYPDNSIDAFFYRISKEKSVNQHTIQGVKQCLKPDGKLFIAGDKNDGIKTFFKQSSDLLSPHKALKKSGQAYWGILSKVDNSPTEYKNNYHELVTITEINGLPIKSKPGVFGWQKVDPGSQLLIEQLLIFNQTYQPSFQSMIDLGCGYGYLTLASLSLEFKQITATDNNAAAITCMQHNALTFNISAKIFAGDCGGNIQEQFDLVLCNPPFHQGFSISGDLTEKFLKSARRLLQPQGQAFFVVNSFIPIEKKATAYFDKIELLHNNKQFKVIAFS